MELERNNFSYPKKKDYYIFIYLTTGYFCGHMFFFDCIKILENIFEKLKIFFYIIWKIIFAAKSECCQSHKYERNVCENTVCISIFVSFYSYIVLDSKFEM